MCRCFHIRNRNREMRPLHMTPLFQSAACLPSVRRPGWSERKRQKPQSRRERTQCNSYNALLSREDARSKDSSSRKPSDMYITKIAKIVSVLILLSVAADGNAKATKKPFNWNPVMDAITKVESEGNPNARSGNCCGAMQIKPICVEDCNRILQERGEKRRYTLKDRFNVKKSREMFVVIMSKYNPTNDVEKAIRIWNGGVKYKVKTTQEYYQKVMKHLHAATSSRR